MTDQPLFISGHSVPVSPGTPAAELTVVVPCYNERANAPVLVERLRAALSGIAWEAVFVDDNSPDGTAEVVRAIAARDPSVRCIRRVGRRGLASAVTEGALCSSASFVAVIDGDLQHDETRLAVMLGLLRQGNVDLIVASRYLDGGDSAGLASSYRKGLSNLGTRFAQAVLPVRVTDPMSGFFMLRREVYDRAAPHLANQGFKILVDLILSAPKGLRVAEVPARFGARVAGESKLDGMVLLEFLGLLLQKLTGGVVPLNFVGFCLVGAFGVLVQYVVLLVGRRAGLDFSQAQTLGTFIAMASNFQLNNSLTYRYRRLRGAKLFQGWILFMLVCGLGAVANIGIARALYAENSGWSAAGVVGAAVGAVWNYAVSATLVWRSR